MSTGRLIAIGKLLGIPGLAPNTVHQTRTSVHAEHPPEQNDRSAITNICSAFIDSFTRTPNTVQVHRTPEQNAKRRTVFSERRTPYMASPGEYTIGLSFPIGKTFQSGKTLLSGKLGYRANGYRAIGLPGRNGNYSMTTTFMIRTLS